jgi:type I restriction-modification system DNA methylase subunit/predicted type IV restriction endonuclease
MPVPARILELTDRFRYNLDSYKSGKYNETQVRLEYINPLMEELGWDMTNKNGYSEAYKDVIHEDAIKVGGVTKAPDYCFRIGGTRKFFLEAKKPSVNIKEDIHPAYQLRRYAWSAKLPLSILTDFEEFAVYDCRVKPVKTDKASNARVMYLKFSDYKDKWDEIARIFSHEAILKGSFDKYVDSKRKKKGTAEVDTAFLEEIERWRELLARNIALRNEGLSQREVNFSVQRTIDRIIFLRICEDRGVEDYGRLMALQNGERVYKRLFQLFREADARYNSGLFYFRPEKGRSTDIDALTPDLNLDDKILKDILKNLYYPDSPYEFSVLPANILGQVYEQFLGKVIRLTPGHRAVIELKPEVRKAGGVYYTPTYIVDYIVKETVGKLVEGKKAGPRGGVSKLKILDPACGSGSFLLGAYQYLLDWHRDKYVKDDPVKWAKGKNPCLYQKSDDDWRLTTDERKRILLNNIYGVDIDHQAVEVTKLSLLLKVLEGEDEETIQRQLSLFQQRALPDLGSNIKCGNSLIGSDFYDGQLNLFDDEEMYRINAFDWDDEFSDIMKNGGFDAVIGNPPWGASFAEDELSYLRLKNEKIIVRMIDSFMYFVHQTSKKVNKSGFFGMILPDVILYQNHNEKLRNYILKNYSIKIAINVGDVFDKVSRPTAILIFQLIRSKSIPIDIADISNIKKLEKSKYLFDKNHYEIIDQNALLEIPKFLFVTSHPSRYELLKKVKTVDHKYLEEFLDDDGIQRGVSPDLKKAFLVDSNTVKSFGLETSKLKKVITGGKHVKRYFIDYPDLFLIYTNRNDNFKKLPNICSYIEKFRNEITCKEVKNNKHPLYSLHRPRKEQIFVKNRKLIGVITGDKIIVALDEEMTYPTDGLYLFSADEGVHENYLMGILNSKLFVFVYRLLTLEKGRVLPQVKPTILTKLPVKYIDFENQYEKSLHDQVVSSVSNMINLKQKIEISKISQTKTILQRQIQTTDRQIDKLVYQLYDLTDEEIKIVEASMD